MNSPILSITHMSTSKFTVALVNNRLLSINKVILSLEGSPTTPDLKDVSRYGESCDTVWSLAVDSVKMRLTCRLREFLEGLGVSHEQQEESAAIYALVPTLDLMPALVPALHLTTAVWRILLCVIVFCVRTVTM